MSQASVQLREAATTAAAARADAPTPVGMAGQNVVCFAKDWDEDPTSNNHIMRLLAEGNRVLWINSIATRRPSLTSGRDLKKIFRKLVSFFKGPKRVNDGLWVYTPVVLPFPASKLATRINTWILRASIRLIRRRLKMKDFQLWVFIPTAGKYAGSLGESLLVYYVTDEYSKFAYVDGSAVAAADEDLTRRADVIFGTAQSLVDKRRAVNPRTYLARHGVEHAKFAAAMDDATEVPADIAALPKPVLGFYGALQHWLDYDLLKHLARRHPEWSIALIGQELIDLSSLSEFPNIHRLGRKPHAQLPAYCKGMSVAMIPHRVNELTLHMNPIKLREYLSAGLPVVSVKLPEVEAYAGQCWVATDYDDFERGVEQALATDSPEARRARSDSMRSETWERRVAAIGDEVMRVWGEKHPAASDK